eukprot:Gb_01532 [translate_table: standard]
MTSEDSNSNTKRKRFEVPDILITDLDKQEALGHVYGIRECATSLALKPTIVPCPSCCLTTEMLIGVLAPSWDDFLPLFIINVTGIIETRNMWPLSMLNLTSLIYPTMFFGLTLSILMGRNILHGINCYFQFQKSRDRRHSKQELHHSYRVNARVPGATNSMGLMTRNGLHLKGYAVRNRDGSFRVLPSISDGAEEEEQCSYHKAKWDVFPWCYNSSSISFSFLKHCEMHRCLEKGIDKNARSLKERDDIKAVASISSGNDDFVVAMIVDAIDKVAQMEFYLLSLHLLLRAQSIKESSMREQNERGVICGILL